MLRSLLFTFFCTCVLAISAQIDGADVARALIDESVTKGHCVGIAAGYMIDGVSSWQDGAGNASLESKTVFTPTTISRTASITKPMTAVAIMQLVEGEKLDLDAPVGDYLPAFNVGEKGGITVRHILQQASGIRAYANGKERENYTNYPALADALKIFIDDALEFDPGTKFGYTSYGYNVLGSLIEKVSGMSYGEYLNANIWKPAGMTQTSIEVAGETYAGKADLYHQKKPGKLKSATATDLSDRVAGGGVQSTVNDLLLFGNALLDGTLIKEETLTLMTTDSGLKKEGNPYGLGFYLYGGAKAPGSVFGHTGAQIGCSSFMMVVPSTKTVLVVLSNTSGAMNEVGRVLNGLLADTHRAR